MMSFAMGPPRNGAKVGWTTGLLAGVVAGLVAAVSSAIVRAVFHATLPPIIPTIGSAFVAGLGGGLLYAALARFLDYPVRGLWILVLLLATVDSVFVAILPAAAGRTPPFLFPLAGLIFPIRQVAALVGLEQFGTGHFPAQFLFANTVIHYVTATSVAVVVPPLVRLLRRTRPLPKTSRDG
jgi:hypothetical protein